MRRRFRLTLQFGFGEAERFHRPHILGVDLRAAILRNLAGFLEFVHALLQARFSVDQSFSSVTHESAHYNAGARCTVHPCACFVIRYICERFSSGRRWSGFSAVFAEPTAPQKRGWPAIARGESTLILAPTGSGKTLTAFLWSLNRLMFEPPPDKPQRCRVLYISPLKALAVDVERNLRAPLAGISNMAAAKGIAVSYAGDRRPHRRHAGGRAREVPASAGRHPDHHAGIAVPAADVERAREPEVGGDGDHRRDSRDGVDQARRAPGAVARAAGTHRRASRCSGSGCRRRSGRSMKSRGTSGGAQRRPHDHEDLEAPRRPKTSKPSRPQDLKTDFAESVHDEFEDDHTVTYRPVTIVDASAPKQLAISVQTPVEDMAAMGKAVEQPSGPASQGPVAQSIWSSIHPRLVELIRVASIDAAVRQQPPPGGAAGRRAQRDRRRAAGARASRLAGARAAHRDRRSAEGRPAARAGRDLVARARHRHGRDRPGDPDRGAAVGGQRPAAHRPRRPQHRPGQRRHHLSEVPRRPGGVRRGHRGDAAGQGRIVALSAQPARRARAAARRDDVDGTMVGRRSLSHRAIGGAVRGAVAADLRRRARHAVGPLSVGRVRRAAAARDVGSRQRHGDGAAGRQARRDRQRRHHSRSRLVRRVPDRRRQGQGARRRARRGNGVRGARRRNVPARRLDVAHRSDHARSRAGLARARRAGQDAVLEGRRPGPARRARHGDRQAGPRSAQGRTAGGARHAAARSRPRRARRRQPAQLSRRTIRRRRRRARRSHDRHRTLARRSRRLARRGADAARQPHPCAVGDGGDRAHPRRSRHRRRGDVVGRWVRGAVSGWRASAGYVAAAARSRRSRAAGRAPARIDGDVLGAVPRSRRPRAAAAPPPSRRPRAAVAAAQARLGSARGGGAIRIVPDHPRDLSRSACATSSTCRR